MSMISNCKESVDSMLKPYNDYLSKEDAAKIHYSLQIEPAVIQTELMRDGDGLEERDENGMKKQDDKEMGKAVKERVKMLRSLQAACCLNTYVSKGSLEEMEDLERKLEKEREKRKKLTKKIAKEQTKRLVIIKESALMEAETVQLYAKLKKLSAKVSAQEGCQPKGTAKFAFWRKNKNNAETDLKFTLKKSNLENIKTKLNFFSKRKVYEKDLKTLAEISIQNSSDTEEIDEDRMEKLDIKYENERYIMKEKSILEQEIRILLEQKNTLLQESKEQNKQENNLKQINKET